MDQLKILGKYHILERLAALPLAETYKAKTVGIAGFEKVQILKRVATHYSQDQRFVRAFIEQAKVAFSLNHRNIVQVFEFGKIDAELFLASEYIPGVNLRQVIHRARREEKLVPVGLTCYLMGEVAAGLEYAHHKTDQQNQSLGVLHADLRPVNVACSFEGSVKVLDFGFARAAWEIVPAADRLQELPRYLAPEQIRGDELTPLADIFSFGAILWELLTGRPLFAGPSTDAVAEAILAAPIPSPRDENPEVPAGLELATMRCLERDPARRFTSANDLQLELHRIQREVGAVIGSRALSSFLRELVPDYDDTRDVRQSSPDDEDPRPAASISTPDAFLETVALDGIPSVPSSDAIAAAAGLALPREAPAEIATDDGGSLDHQTEEGATTTERPPVRRLRRTRSSGAGGGALRPPRESEEDLPPSLPRVLHRTDRGLDLARRRELTAGAEPPPLPLSEDQLSPAELTPPPDPLLTPVVVPKPPRRHPEPDPEPEPEQTRELAEPTTAPATIRAASLRTQPSAPAAIAPDLDETSDPSPADLPALRDELDEVDGASHPDAAVPAALTAMLGERKQFIAVAVKISAPGAVAAEAVDLLANIAYKLDGLLHEQRSDALLVIFGLPTYHENDIVSAMRFAFDAHEAVSHLALRHSHAGEGGTDPRPRLRIGVRAGTARMSGQPAKEGYQIIGHSLREAHALAAHAEQGQILVAGAAARLAAAHYVLRTAPSIRRFGKPIRAHRVMAPLSGPRERRVSDAEPITGREMEIKALRTIWREALTGGGQRTVLVVGDPGVGKTHLVDAFIAQHCSEAREIVAVATPHRQETPFALIGNLLRGLAGVWAERGSRGRKRLLGRLERILCAESLSATDPRETMDTLAAALDPGGSSMTGSGPGFARTRLYRALRALLHAAGSGRPLVVHLEDLHWIDSSSLDCLRALVERAGDATVPTLVVITVRPDERIDAAQVFPSESVSVVQLDELDETHRQRLIVDVLAERANDAVVAEIERRAGGNPFLIRELCQAITEGADAESVPSNVQGLITSRVDRLPPEVKVVLQHATVIGATFREGILTALLARNPARQLAELRNRSFLLPSANMAVAVAPTATGISEQFERLWSFRHVAVQETVYQSLHATDRRQLHRKVGEIMVRRVARGSGDSPDEIARHLELGGRLDQAAEYYVRAADEATATYANVEAAELYDRALRLAEGDPQLHYRALSGRERISGRLGLKERQAADLLTLRRLCGDDAQRLADLRTREALHLLHVGELYRALEAAEQAEEAARAAENELLRGEALQLRGEAYGRLNDHQRAINAATQALAIFEHEGSVRHQVRARIALGRIHLLLARYDEAFQHYDPALELIEKTSDRWHERILRNNLAIVHACRGDFARAQREAAFSLELCRQFGDRAREGDNSSVLGIVHLELGSYATAREHIERALRVHRETGSQWGEADTLVYAGLVEGAEGHHARALELLARARAIADPMGAKYIAVNARNAAAMLLCDRNHAGDAARAVDEATIAFETAQGAGLIVGEIPGLARAARATALLGDVEAARALSRRAVELLREQRNIESSEEEIYYTHFRILDRLGDPSALEFIERAHSGLMGKLALLDDADARRTMSEEVRLNAAIRRDYLRAQETKTTI